MVRRYLYIVISESEQHTIVHGPFRHFCDAVHHIDKLRARNQADWRYSIDEELIIEDEWIGEL